jgi:hypothetical protein
MIQAFDKSDSAAYQYSPKTDRQVLAADFHTSDMPGQALHEPLDGTPGRSPSLSFD